MPQSLTNGVIVPNADGKEIISSTGVEEMRALGVSADAQIGARATISALTDTENRLQTGIGDADEWIRKLREFIQDNGGIRGAGIVDLHQDTPGTLTITWMDPEAADETTETIDLPAGFANLVEVSPGVWEFSPDIPQVPVGQILGLDDALAAVRRGVSVREYGAAGDGESDDSAAFSAALEAGGPVYVPGGTYRLSTVQATGPVDLTLAADATIVHEATDPLITITGTEGSEVALSADVATASTTLTAPGHGLEAGDFLRLGSDLLWDAHSTSIRHGEILRVAAVDGDIITVTTPIQGGPYTVADGAVVTRLGLVNGVRITGGTIRGKHEPDLAQTGILVRLARNVTIEGINFDGIDYRHIALEDCLDAHVVRTAHDWAQDHGMAYGIAVTGASQDVEVVGSRFVDVRHAVTTSNLLNVRGVTRRLLVADCVLRRSLPALNDAESGGDGFDTHTAADWVTFDRNVVDGPSGGGINIECRNSRVRWNTIIAPNGAGISVHSEGDQDGSTEIIGNTIIAGPDTTYGIRVMPSTRGAGTTLRGVTVSGNTVDGVQSTPIYIGSPSGPTLWGVTAIGNMGRNNPGSYLVRIYNSANVEQSGNNAATGTKGVLSEDVAPLVDDPGFLIGNLTDGTATVPAGVHYLRLAVSGTQDLTTLNGGGRGQIVTIRLSLASSVLNVRTTGNIELAAPITLTGVYDALTVAWTGTKWSEVSRRLTAQTMVPHDHAIADVEDLQAALDAKGSATDSAALAARLAVLEQDTGDRDITSLAPGFVSGKWTLARVGPWVYMNMYAVELTPTASTYWQQTGWLPSGFRPPASSQYTRFETGVTTTSDSSGPVRIDRYGGITIYDVADKTVHVTAVWLTRDAFPTTPPGEPA